MSGNLFLFDDEQYQPSSPQQREAYRKALAEKRPQVPDENPSAKQDPLLENEKLPPLANWKSDRQYHSISEVAQIFGLNVSHIRHWTTEFKLKVRTTRKGDRLYKEENIQELARIYQLMKKEGMTIKGTKNKINQPAEFERRQKLIHDLKDLQAELQALIKHLKP